MTIRPQLKFVLLCFVLGARASLPKIPYRQFRSIVESGHQNGLEALMDSGQKVGAFAITHLDELDLDYSREVRALTSKAPACVQSLADVLQVQLNGDSTRSTYALERSDHPDCIQEQAGLILEAFDEIETLVSMMIKVAHGQKSGEYKVGTSTLDLMDAPVKTHLHVYAKSAPGVGTAEHLVPFHVDNGLFLLLTPFPENSLRVRQSNGKEISTQDVDQNSMLVLMGRGTTDWLEQDMSSSLFHPVPHSVPPLSDAVPQRAVVARMKVVEDEAVPAASRGNIKFGEVFMATGIDYHQLCMGAANQERPSRSLPSWTKLNKEVCEENTKYCWMSCLPLPEDGCSSEQSLACLNDFNQTDPCFEDGNHDASCHWTCQDPQPPTPEPEEPSVDVQEFCRGKTDMLMLGFELSGKGGFCIILFFDAWTLDTRLKFGFGCFGVFLMGLFLELLILLRRTIQKKAGIFRGINPWVRKSLIAVAFAVNLILGYLAMLVAMTYSVELFLSVCLGIILGHVAFNSSEPVGETIDPCCAASQNEVTPVNPLGPSSSCCANEKKS